MDGCRICGKEGVEYVVKGQSMGGHNVEHVTLYCGEKKII